MFYVIIKWLHVLAAVIALGSNATYGFWLGRAAGSTPENHSFTLRTIKMLDDRMANPSYIALLLTGVILFWVGDFPISTPWLLVAIVIYVGVALLVILGYSRVLRKQIQIAESEGVKSEAYKAMAARGRRLGMLTGLLALVILYLMVAKPKLWG